MGRRGSEHGRSPSGMVGRTTSVLVAGLVVLTSCGDDDGGNRRGGGDGRSVADTEAEPGGGPGATSGGCNDDAEVDGVAPADLAGTPPEATSASLENLELSLTEIGEFDEPTSLASRPGDTDLFVTEKAGRLIRLVVEGEGPSRSYTPGGSPLLDLSDEVVSEEYEQGLLDLTFSPDGQRLYLSYTAHGATDGGDSVVTSYTYDGEGLDEASRKEVLTEAQPTAQHNGGNILFGPDGCLYVGLGDGTPIGDAYSNGQDTSTLLGTIVRIDPEATVGTGVPYTIPADNPFVDPSTRQDDDPDDPRPEIWLYGVRNPWRSSFDPLTGDLWVADVGEKDWEEINHLPAEDGAGQGANLGWSEMEGTHSFEGGTNPPEGILPVFDYPNPDEGVSVAGGVVYRGSAVDGLEGAYLFGDFGYPALRALTLEGGQAQETSFDDVEVLSLTSFGVDTEGEVYLVSLQGPVYRLDP